ncbi:MAG: flagella basal body P-ring formation protein FlgA [Sphingomonadaceae bacterium]
MIRLACFPLLALVPGSAAPLSAQTAHTEPAAIDRVVERFTGSAIGQPGGAREPVDRRLRLSACGQEPVATWHGSPGRTVTVACPGPGGWRVFVNLVVSPSREPETGLAAGSAGASAVRQLPMIKRGESLTVMVTGRGFAIRRTAEALGSGSVGEWIAVRTTPGGEPLRARIMQPGLAEIPLP